VRSPKAAAAPNAYAAASVVGPREAKNTTCGIAPKPGGVVSKMVLKTTSAPATGTSQDHAAQNTVSLLCCPIDAQKVLERVLLAGDGPRGLFKIGLGQVVLGKVLR